MVITDTSSNTLTTIHLIHQNERFCPSLGFLFLHSHTASDNLSAIPVALQCFPSRESDSYARRARRSPHPWPVQIWSKKMVQKPPEVCLKFSWGNRNGKPIRGTRGEITSVCFMAMFGQIHLLKSVIFDAPRLTPKATKTTDAENTW